MSFDVLLARSGTAKLSTFNHTNDAEDQHRQTEEPISGLTNLAQPHHHHRHTHHHHQQHHQPHHHHHHQQHQQPPHLPTIEEPAVLAKVSTHDTAGAAPSSSKKPQPDGTPHSSGSSTGGTPIRKISASKFMSALTQFYSGDNSASATTTSSEAGIAGDEAASKGHQRSNDDSFPEIKGRVESKIMSMWHNVKYGWSGKIRSNFSKEQPVWLLGRCYHRKFSPISSMENSAEMTSSLENKLYLNEPAQPQSHPSIQHPQDELLDPTVQEFGTDAIEGENSDLQWEEGIEGFKRDFFSRFWMTYRREFPILNNSSYTSDCGWGCMLRSGQMLLAQAMVCHFLGRSWRWDPESQLHSTHDDNMHRKIIRWFGDSSSKNSPFSIHTLVTLGQDTGKKPGDWYGPSSVSHLLKHAVKLASQENADFDDIHVYVAQDCTVYIQDILDECLVPDPPIGPVAPWQQRKTSTDALKMNPSANMHWKALILLVPLRLGAEKLNPIYGNSLKTLLSTEYCIGIIGGRPKHSLYFIGFQEDKLIHLDPHYCQEMVDVNQENFPAQSFHCKSPRKLKLNKMDPCCCIGFYCQTRSDFDNFVASVQPYLLPVRSQPTPTMDRSQTASPSSQVDTNYPMFVFSRSRSSDQQTEDIPESAYTLLHQQLRNFRLTDAASTGFDDDDDDETEEFVII